MTKFRSAALFAAAVAAFCLANPSPAGCAAQGAAQPQRIPISPVLCPRYAPGSALVEPKDLFSSHGVLRVGFTYRMRIDQAGNTHYCFMTEDGLQSPTLHVHPGDELLITLKNEVPAALKPSFTEGPTPYMQEISGMPDVAVSGRSSIGCGGMDITASYVRLLSRGESTSPGCHQNEVVKTLINSGEMFQYDLHFPAAEAPGLYWYHPHIRGIAEPAMQGGASGAIIVEGIQEIHQDVAGLQQRTLIVRDNLLSAYSSPGETGPVGTSLTSDLSLNYIPVAYPGYAPPVIQMKPLQKQFWRVLNASADTVLDLVVQYDGTPQALEVVGDGGNPGKMAARKHILLAPAAHAEFVVTGPGEDVKNARLLTLNLKAGSSGQTSPERPLATIKPSTPAADQNLSTPEISTQPSVPDRLPGAPAQLNIEAADRRPSPLR